MKTGQDLLNDVKPELKGIALKTYGFCKEALIEAVNETKTPLDNMAVDALIKSYDAKVLAKIEAI